MGTAVPIPDAGAQAALDTARSDAAAQLKSGGDRLSKDLASMETPSSTKVKISASTSDTSPTSTAPVPGPAETGAVDTGEINQVTIPKDANVAPIEQPSYGDAAWDNTKQTFGEIGKGLERGGVGVAKTAGLAAGLVAHSWAQALDDLTGGKAGLTSVKTNERTLANGKKVSGEFSQDDNSAAGDKAFDFLRDHISTAMDYWKSDPEANSGARLLGNVAEAGAPLLLGPAAGVPAFAASAGANAGIDSIDRGEDARTAATLATVHATAAVLYPAIGKIPLKTPTLLKRVGLSIGLGEPISILTDYLTKEILDSNGYKEAAKNIDPLNPESIVSGSLIQAIFGVLDSPKVQKRAAEITKNGGATVPGPADTGATWAGKGVTAEGNQVTPVDVSVPQDNGAKKRIGIPGEDLSAQVPPAATPPPAAAPPPPGPSKAAASGKPIADTPSAEPPHDLVEQVKELDNPLSGRSGVYLSPENVAALGPDGVRALSQGRPISSNFGGNGAVMIFADKGERVKGIAAAKANGADMQAVIGKITGAGDGKRPDQTLVVQGQTPEGAVVSEGAVAPHEAPAAIDKVKAEGNTPVITTPEAAVQRRATLVAGDHAVVDGRAVVIAGAAKDGSVPVREIDHEGNVSDTITPVPAAKLPEVEQPKPKGKTAAQLQAEAMLGGTTETQITPRKASSEEPAKNTEPATSSKAEVAKPKAVKTPDDVAEEFKADEARGLRGYALYRSPDTGVAYEVQRHDDGGVVARVIHSDGQSRDGAGGSTEPVTGDIAQWIKDREAKLLTKSTEPAKPEFDAPEGYKITYKDGVLEAHDAAGNKVGEAGIGADSGTGKHVPQMAFIDVDPAHRRKGIASAFYAAGEKIVGEKFKPSSGSTSPEAMTVHVKRGTAQPERIHGLDKSMDYLRENGATKGKKGSLADRANIVASSATVLRSAAEHAAEKGLADKPAIERALAAAKAAEDLNSKSAEDINKGRGVDHATLDYRAREILNAAEQLQGREAPPPEAMPLKAKKLAKVIEKSKAEATKADAAAKGVSEETILTGEGDKTLREIVSEAKKRGVRATLKDIQSAFEVSSSDALKIRAAMKETVAKTVVSKATRDQGKEKPIADIEDEGKKAAADAIAREQREADQPLRKLERHERASLSNAMEAVKGASRDTLKFHRDKLAMTLERLYEPRTEHQKRAVEAIKADADAQRAKYLGEVRDPREDENDIDEALGPSGTGFAQDHTGRGFVDKEHERPYIGGDDGVRWDQVHKDLNFKHNVFAALGAGTGNSVPVHTFLSRVMESARKGSPIHDLATKLYHTVNALPIIEATKDMASRRIFGAYGSTRDEQGRTKTQRIRISTAKPNDPVTTQGVMHEIVHAAGSDFMDTNPDHPAVKELERLRGIAEDRLRRMFAERGLGEAFDQSVNYHRNGGAEPLMHIAEVYGVSDIHEYHAELNTNPRFKGLLAKSEAYAAPGERMVNILHATTEAIAKMFGITRPDTLRLLNASLRVSDSIFDAARRTAVDRTAPGIRTGEMEARARAYDSTPPPGSTVNEYASPEIERRSIHEPGSIEHERDVQDHAKEVLDRPYTMRNEQLVRDVGGSTAARVAKMAYKAVRSGVIGRLEEGVMPFKTEDQLVRDGIKWYGTNTAANPLRKWHEAQTFGANIQNEILARGQPIFSRAAQLTPAENKTLGEFMRDSTQWGIDPTVAADKHSRATKAGYKFDARYDEYQKRWANLPPHSREIYTSLRDFNQWAMRRQRNVGIDTALRTFSDTEIPDAQRRMLYSVTDPKQYEKLIGKGKALDVGDRNKNLISSLVALAGRTQMYGPYFHLGRHGDIVVHMDPEGTKSGFKTREAAEGFADLVRNLSPESEAQVSENPDGTHNVDFKADYVSMHEKQEDAMAEIARLESMGFDAGNATRKLSSNETGGLSIGVENLVGELTRRLKGGNTDTEHVQELTDALRKTFTQIMAARSAYAGSQLARKGTGGVKGEEMLRNAAGHTASLAWATGQLASTFQRGEALGAMRTAVKQKFGVDQRVSFERGRVLTEIQARMAQDHQQVGMKMPMNSALAKLGFANFLGSPSHALIWMTQNFTTSLPVAAARWGGFRSTRSFAAAMSLVSGPAFRETFLAHLPKQLTKGESVTVHHVVESVLKAVRNDPRFGHWAAGENSLLKQVFDRGAISNSFSNELASIAHSESPLVTKVMDYARLLPHMADTINRVSSALVGLEMTGGDAYKAADFVKETHMDYSGANKPRVFKAANRLIGGNSITMFKTYAQGMAHLLYANAKHMSTINLPEGAKSRKEAALTVAGMMGATMMLAGISGGIVIEPLRLAMYAWHKMFSDDDVHDLDASIDEFSNHVATHVLGDNAVGRKVGEVAARGLPRAIPFGFDADLSSRLGLSGLFFHNPPDLLKGDGAEWSKFAASQLGPMPEMIGGDIASFNQHWRDGEPWKALGSLVPIKAVGDLTKAVQEGTTGKIGRNGEQLTKPSIPGAIVRGIGFRTGDEARASERLSVAAEQTKAQYELKAQILTRAARQGYTGDVAKAMDAYNDKYPDTPIKRRDIVSKENAKAAAERIVSGDDDPTRSEIVNKKLKR